MPQAQPDYKCKIVSLSFKPQENHGVTSEGHKDDWEHRSTMCKSDNWHCRQVIYKQLFFFASGEYWEEAL